MRTTGLIEYYHLSWRMGKCFPNEDDRKGRPNRLCEAKRIFAWVSARRSVCLDLRCVRQRAVMGARDRL